MGFSLFIIYLTQLAPVGSLGLPDSGITDKVVLTQVCNLLNTFLTMGICKIKKNKYEVWTDEL